ncbi:MAG: hypothetical protein IJ646_03685, partial [Clostridia bacterium]|nr:hypothetical protein [Clostridia bacterium]
LGGDAALVTLAAANSSSNADFMRYAKSYFDSAMNAIALAYPSFKPFVPFLTALSADIFSTGGNINAQVLNKLDEIEGKIQEAEDSIKRNTYDVVSLQAIGDKYSTVADKAEHIQEMIGNIAGNTGLTDAERLQKLADLTDNSEFAALESAMDGATRCFTSNVNDLFERQSIFDAAYAKACGTVMFSSEAIDISMPYIVRQFAVYAAAYGVMNQVYDAHEQVYGASSLTATRQKQLQRLGGIDLNGKKVDGAIADQIKAYLSRDRYVFINKGTSNIALDRAVLVRKFDFTGNVNRQDPLSDSEKNAVKSEISSIPLNDKQVEAISSYAGSKGRCLFDFLFNDMHFAPLKSGSGKLGSDPRPFKDLGISKGFDGLPLNPKIKPKPTKDDPTYINSAQFTFAYPLNEETQNWLRPSNSSRKKYFLVDGKQTLKYTIDDYNRQHYVKAYLLNALNVGAEYERQKIIYEDFSSEKWYSYITADIWVFQGR